MLVTARASDRFLARLPAHCISAWDIRHEYASGSAEVLLIRLIFGNLCFVPPGLFQEGVPYRALRQKRCLVTCFSRAFGGLFDQLLISLASLLAGRHPFELFPNGRGGVADLVDRSQQLLSRHIKRASPALQFVRLVHLNPRAVRVLSFGQAFHERLSVEKRLPKALVPVSRVPARAGCALRKSRLCIGLTGGHNSDAKS